MSDLLKGIEKREWELDPEAKSFTLPGQDIGLTPSMERVRRARLIPVVDLASYETLERMFLKAVKQRNEWASLESDDFIAKYLPKDDAELRAIAESKERL
jgi:hypothetical protein